MKRFLSLAFCAACSLCGCESTGVGNPDRLSVTAVSALSAEPDADAAAPDEQLTRPLSHAVLAVKELRWSACDSALKPVVVPGPYVVDLVSGHTDPPFASVAIPNGGFCGLDAPLSIDATDVIMQGKSILLAGNRGDGTLFILYAAMPGTIRLRPYPSDLTWDIDNAKSVIWALQPQRWLTQSELDAEPVDALGTRRNVIAIDVNRHPLLYTAIRNRIGARSTLNADFNGNGQLDPDDETAVIGLGQQDLN